MDMRAYIEEIKLKLTGGILECELDDKTIEQIVNSAFRELQRYIDSTRIATIKYSPCIDLSEWPISSVSRVFRAKGYFSNGDTNENGVVVDPMYAMQWQVMTGLNSFTGFQNFTYDFGAWNTASQIRNTMSTDLLFRFDKYTNKLYINVSYNRPEYITIEYVPRFDDVSQIVSDFWIDKLCRLSLALAKVTVGRIRNRFTQSNALWAQDGETLITEGNTELETLRAELLASTSLCYPLD